MKNLSLKILGILIIAIMLFQGVVVAAQSSEGQALEGNINKNEEKIDEAQQRLEDLENEKSQAMKEVEKITNEISNYESQIDELDSKIGDLNTQIRSAEEKIKQAEADYTKRQALLEARLVATYEAGETSYLDVLLSSKSVIDLISNYYLVSELAENDTDLLKEIQTQKEEIEKAKTTLESNKKELDESKASKQSVSTQLKNSKSEKDKQVSKLNSEEKQTAKEIEELRAANARIANEIKAAEAKYQKELDDLNKEEGKDNGGVVPPAGSGFFMRPTSGSISATAYYSSGKFHGAIDYAVSNGTPVYAAAAGVVMSTANLSDSYGTYVVIRHANGLQSYYAHGTYGSIIVSPGTTVKKGQQIMKSGNTGNSSGPHLHFEVRRSPYSHKSSATAYGQDSRVNPANYM